MRLSAFASGAPGRVEGKKRQRPKAKVSADEKKQTLHALLEQTKADLARSRNGQTLTRPESPLPEEETIKVLGDEYFLLLFYEHVSYKPREVVDLSGWGPDITPAVSFRLKFLYCLLLRLRLFFFFFCVCLESSPH